MESVTPEYGAASKCRMVYRLVLPLTLLMLAELPGSAQFGGNPYPVGGSGGGGGMGIPGIGGMQVPGTRRGNGRNNNAQTQTLTGKLHRVSTSQFDLDPGDGRIITVSIERTTRYFNANGGAGKLGDFDIGDQVSIDATSDNQNFYHAQRVTMQVKAASAPDSVSSNDRPSEPSTPADSDPDRPRLKRSSGSSGPQAQITQGDPVVADVPSKPVPREADDPGPPKLKRGVPARVDNTPPAGSQASESVASVRPSLHADESNGVTRRPDAPIISSGQSARQAPQQTSGDPVINGAREAAMSFTDTLPNYVVKQFTTRYQSDSVHGNRTSWQALDVVTADVVTEGGKESYKNILVNGKAPRDSVEKTGSWSTGEFATVLQGILATQTDADFHSKRSTTIVNRPAFRYDYSVEQPNSMWHVFASAQSYVPGYTGSIWIDKENNRVLRIEMSAKNMPKEFPLDTVESAVDYDYVLIGDSKYLLPVHSEALSCIRGTSDCTRNVIDFRNYKKFGADTTIKFDTN